LVDIIKNSSSDLGIEYKCIPFIFDFADTNEVSGLRDASSETDAGFGMDGLLLENDESEMTRSAAFYSELHSQYPPRRVHGFD
jgi:hypothetical protein